MFHLCAHLIHRFPVLKLRRTSSSSLIDTDCPSTRFLSVLPDTLAYSWAACCRLPQQPVTEPAAWPAGP